MARRRRRWPSQKGRSARRLAGLASVPMEPGSRWAYSWNVPYGTTEFVATGWDQRAGDQAAWTRSFVADAELSAWAFGPDGMIAKRNDGITAIEHADGGTLALTPTSGMIKMAFSPDGALLAAADAAGMVHLIRPGDAVVERVIEAGGYERDPAASLEF